MSICKTFFASFSTCLQLLDPKFEQFDVFKWQKLAPKVVLFAVADGR